jgi:membrane-bound metal-dependent hydrolase YbcI (DUF457 family)
MPLPLGHTAIGFATHSLCCGNNPTGSLWRLAVFVTILSNLPDIDVVIGILLQGNGSVYHRGPTHSLLFSAVLAFPASMAPRFWSWIPNLSYRACFMVILSHVLADLLFTTSPVSLFWPFEINCVSGHSGWMDIINSVFLESSRDMWIISASAAVILLNQVLRKRSVLAAAIKKLTPGHP